MGWNDHIDWDMLQMLDELLERGFIDDETDAELIEAINAIANETATKQQEVLFQKQIGPLAEKLEAEKRMEEMLYKISKDD